MHKVTVIQNGRTTDLKAEHGQRLSDILMLGSADFQHPCACKGICRKCTVIINGKKELSCRYEVKSDITVILPDSETTEIIESANIEFSENVAVVIDIGTTTIEGVLTDKNNNNSKIIKTLNPQRVFGADVISRTEYCEKNGTEKMQKILLDAINGLSNKLLDSYNIEAAEKMYIAGNTAMLHTFFGEDCSGFTKSPYTPVFLEERTVPAHLLGIKKVNTVSSLPCISCFVGADIVAGLNSVGMPENNRYNLLVDLGTNAEIVLYSREKGICTASAAGPCFEGANISCGMSAVGGAVYSYSQEHGCKTLNNEKPVGLCATGLIDVVAELIRNDIIDDTGYIEKDFRIAENVTLTQADIRQFQLAKSAVYSAITTLIYRMGISFRDIDKCFVTGGFASKLNIGNAILTGLLPLEIKNRISCLDNSSLDGSVKYANEKNDLTVYTKNTVYADLSSDSMFAKKFIENMHFTTY